KFNEAARVIRRHVTKPEEHRRRARGQECLQLRGRAPGCRPLRPPVARYLVAVRPVRRARHNCRAEAVEDRPSPGVRLPGKDFADPAPRQPKLVPDLLACPAMAASAVVVAIPTTRFPN